MKPSAQLDLFRSNTVQEILHLLMHAPDGMTSTQLCYSLSLNERSVGRSLLQLSLEHLIERREKVWHYVALPLNGPKKKG